MRRRSRRASSSSVSRGKHSIIVIEHDMVFVRQIATKVTVLHQGTILCEGTVDEVQNNERVIEVYLGRKART